MFPRPPPQYQYCIDKNVQKNLYNDTVCLIKLRDRQKRKGLKKLKKALPINTKSWEKNYVFAINFNFLIPVSM